VPIEVVIGLLAVLELYKRSLVELDQTSTFGDIAVRWTGGDLADPIDMTVEEPA
jgi:chromatin segregation and condensation protein Rec8/ScpA/Scc1 (kleisin family)